MRYGSEHKNQTRERILQEASAAIRKYGTAGIGVSGIMARLGLTHGGFYAHFQSKDDLVAQAVTQGFDERYAVFLEYTDKPDPAIGLGSFIEYYLSEWHLDTPECGCPIPALAAELSRLSNPVRERFQAGFDRLASNIAVLLARIGIDEPMQQARSTIAEMSGAVALARAIRDRKQAEATLLASRTSLLTRLWLNETPARGRTGSTTGLRRRRAKRPGAEEGLGAIRRR